MNNYTVRANEGFESGPMSYAKALVYAERLRRLGNYAVWVRISQ
jgi:hypothetical protein